MDKKISKATRVDRLIHYPHVVTCNSDSYRLADAKRQRAERDKPSQKAEDA